MNHLGADSGSREPDPQAVPALSGFDPERIAALAKEADRIGEWAADAKSFYACEDVSQLEGPHDSLADAVKGLAGVVRDLATAISHSGPVS